MQTTEQIATARRRPQRGVLAMLRGLFGAEGTGAPSPTHAIGTGAPSIASADAAKPSQRGRILPTTAQRRVGGGQAGKLALSSLAAGASLAPAPDPLGAAARASRGSSLSSRAPRARTPRARSPFAKLARTRLTGAPNLAPYRFLGLLAGLLVFAAMNATPASAAECTSCSAWWHVTSGSRPTNLQPGGVGVEEVQTITVWATEGDFTLEDPENGRHREIPPLPYNVTPAALQTVLEELYGPGVEEVTGGEGNKEGTDPYKITFFNIGRPLKPVVAEPFGLVFGEFKPLAGGVREGKPAEGNSAIEAKVLTPASFKGAQLVAHVSNLGDATANGAGCGAVAAGTGKYTSSECNEEAEPGKGDFEKTPIKITDHLPAGLTAVGIEANLGEGSTENPECSLATLTCTTEHALAPYDSVEVRIDVKVEAAAKTGELNEVSVSGAQTPGASVSRGITVSPEQTPFGVENFELAAEESGGGSDTQAGSHPFQTTVTTTLNQSVGEFNPALGKPEALPAALPKDLDFSLPPGLIGNPTPFPRCSLAQFFHKPQPTCAAQTVVGVSMTTFDEPGILGIDEASVPVFNLEPQEGEPARFGFLVTNDNPVFIDAAVRSGQDYGVMGLVNNITQTAALISNETVFWGVPGDSRHDGDRREGCIKGTEACQPIAETNPPPLFELPTSCTGELKASVVGDSWTEPISSGAFPTLATTTMPALDGCNQLPFRPSIKVTPDGTAASSATGLTVDVHNPQEESLNPEGLGEADVKQITVALPEGVAINPAGGNGLQACSEGLVGFTGFTDFLPGDKSATFTGSLPKPEEPGVNVCPNAAKIGEAEIVTPLLKNPIKGFVYLATQNENPFGSLIAMYIIADDPESGVLVKLTGEVHLTASGQIVTTFDNNPQAPFEDAKLHFFGGERAPLATPSRCGAYTTTASFVPWSQEPGEGPHTASSTFNITSGPNGAPCPGASLPFSPSVTGGATNINAGAFSPFTLTLSRKDGEQNMQSVEAHLPPGLSGILSNIQLCPEPQADLGECPSGSLIGESTVSVGVGGDPFSVSGGKFYLTGPYNGAGGCTTGTPGCAPFGVTFEVPAKAGPFDLERNSANPAGEDPCDCVVVRGKIEIDPHTAAITITSNPPGTPYSIPTSIEGIPLEIQHINAITTRGNFQFNPTNCEKMQTTATIHSSEGGTDTLGVPFQVTNCAVLKFTPTLAVSTIGKASKLNGTSLNFKIAYPKGAMGSQSWFREAKFDIPKQLPARLTTIQQACLAATFETNRTACPKHSIIGHAIVHTPVLPVPLEGPVYFVSYGGAAFPDAVLVLKGYGITVELHGNTFIDGKTGVTSATFKSTPDVPFESIEVSLPTGEYSEFGANLPGKGNYDFCGQKLVMPTFFKAQNGLEIHQNTPVSVTGCKKTLTRAQKLAAALKACHKKKGKKRASCEKAARKKYGAKASKAKHSKHKAKH